MSLLWVVVALTVGGWLALVGIVGVILYTGAKRRLVGEDLERAGRRPARDDDVREPVT